MKKIKSLLVFYTALSLSFSSNIFARTIAPRLAYKVISCGINIIPSILIAISIIFIINKKIKNSIRIILFIVFIIIALLIFLNSNAIYNFVYYGLYYKEVM